MDSINACLYAALDNCFKRYIGILNGVLYGELYAHCPVVKMYCNLYFVGNLYITVNHLMLWRSPAISTTALITGHFWQPIRLIQVGVMRWGHCKMASSGGHSLGGHNPPFARGPQPAIWQESRWIAASHKRSKNSVSKVENA